MALPELLSGGKTLDTIGLTPTEKSLLSDTIEKISLVYNEYGVGLSNVLKANKDFFLTGAEIAKKEFKNPEFGGAYLPSGFNAGLIRPASFLSQTSTPTTVNETFAKAGPAALGWNNLFGSDSNKYNTGLITSGTTQIDGIDIAGPNSITYTYENVAYMIPGLVSFGSAKISEIKVYISSTKYPVYRLSPVRLGGSSAVYYYPLPVPMYLGMNTSFAIEANYVELGDQDIQPLGLQYSKSEYLQYK